MSELRKVKFESKINPQNHKIWAWRSKFNKEHKGRFIVEVIPWSSLYRSDCIVTKCHKIQWWGEKMKLLWNVKKFSRCICKHMFCLPTNHHYPRVYYHFNTIHVCLKLLALRTVLYKRATVCVLVYQQFERQEYSSGYRVQCDISIGAGVRKFTNIHGQASPCMVRRNA